MDNVNRHKKLVHCNVHISAPGLSYYNAIHMYAYLCKPSILSKTLSYLLSNPQVVRVNGLASQAEVGRHNILSQLTDLLYKHTLGSEYRLDKTK